MRLSKQPSKANSKVEFLLILISFFQFNAFSQSDPGMWTGFQPSKDVIIKFKIARLGIKDSATNYRWDYYFDKYGHDSAMYTNDKLSWTKKYVRNKEGKIIKYTRYDSNHVVEYVANYKYSNDGTYSISFNDYKYVVEIITQDYNKKGQILAEFITSGTQHFYKYDSAGKLLGMNFIPGLCAFGLFESENYYDANNILVSVKTIYYPFRYEVLEKFFYDNKGLLIKSDVTVFYPRDEKEFNTSNYTYFFRK